MQRRSRVLAGVLGLLVTTTACVTSSPQARPITAPKRVGDVVVMGRLFKAAETPAARRPVLVTREQTLGNVVTDLFLTAFSAGFAVLSCVTSANILESCRQNGYAGTTTATGSYGLRLRKGDVEGASHLQLASGLPPRAPGLRGATVSVTLTPGPRVRLPALTFAATPPSVRPHASRIDVEWTAPSGGDVASYALGVVDPGRGLTLDFRDVSSPFAVDPRLVEDAVPTYGVVTRGTVDGFDTTWSTPTVRRAGTAGAPYSRGRPCRVGTHRLSRCWLTDGEFAKGYAARRPATVTNPVVDLGRDIPLAFIVTRGEVIGTRLEASTDGRSWSFLGTPTAESFDQPATLVPPAGAHARYIRVQAEQSLSTLSELSVWKGTPAPPPTDAGSHRGTSTGWKWLVAAVAAVLVLLVGAALVRFVGSRT